MLMMVVVVQLMEGALPCYFTNVKFADFSCNKTFQLKIDFRFWEDRMPQTLKEIALNFKLPQSIDKLHWEIKQQLSTQ